MKERFGNYELLEKIAVGGMAEIYKARSIHDKGIEKIVCIKRIHPSLCADSTFIAMFVDEARLGVSLIHGNIVPVFDFGNIDGHYFLAMEFINGFDLASLCGRANVVGISWPKHLAVYILIQVLEGLSYAHLKKDTENRPLNLVHRDVSPSNVLVSTDGQVKILDFGIARSQAREYETKTGVIKGKLGYMSPQQALGKLVDARADIWSCGALLHELLTGRKLKNGRKRCEDTFLEAIIEKALSPELNERYQNARELQNVLADGMELLRKRPNSQDLSDFVKTVYTKEAPGENWDMRSAAIEKHLAKVLSPLNKDFIKDQIDEPVTAKISSIDSSIESDLDSLQNLDTYTENILIKNKFMKSGLFAATFIAVTIGIVIWFDFFSLNIKAADTTGDVNTVSNNISSNADTNIKLDTANVASIAGTESEINSGLDAEHLTDKIDTETETKTKKNTQSAIQLSKLAIATNPQGATISIDNEIYGKSPLTIAELSVGSHMLAAKLKGRLVAKQKIDIKFGETTFVKMTLFKNETPHQRGNTQSAILFVNSDPWSLVSLDGIALGQTPIRNKKIKPGKHKIIMTNTFKKISKVIKFFIKSGETKKISEKLGDYS